MRVAAGAIAKKYLREQFSIEVRGFLSQIGEVKIAPQAIDKIDWDKVNSNPFFCPDESAVEKFDELIRELKKEGDSIWCQTNRDCRECSCWFRRACF